MLSVLLCCCSAFDKLRVRFSSEPSRLRSYGQSVRLVLGELDHLYERIECLAGDLTGTLVMFCIDKEHTVIVVFF